MRHFILFSGIGEFQFRLSHLLCKIENLPDMGGHRKMDIKDGFTTFYFMGHPVRVTDINGEPWFVGKDVALALGYSNTRKALGDHCKPKGVTKRYSLTKGGRQMLACINEGNLYRLTTHSGLPDADKFEEWIFDEVIPTIRKTGGYGRQISDFMQRYLLNYGQVPPSHFSVISELFCTVYGAFESAGHRLADKAMNGMRLRPDVSAGRCFSDFLKANGFDEKDGRIEYDHRFPDGYSVKAFAYPNKLLGVFRDFVYEEWLPKRAAAYLKSRDPKALEFLPKLLA